MRTSKMKISLALVSCVLLVCVVNAEDAVVEEVTDSSSEKAASAIEKVQYVSPEPDGDVYLAEHFDNPEAIGTKWVKSQAKKEGTDESLAKYDGLWAIEPASKEPIPGDLGLVMKSKAKHAAISALLEKPFHFTDKPLIVQYDVTLQNGQECGGAYLKLLQYDKEMRLSQFTDKTPYTIMFGPDKCGNDHKLHFIFQHKNPKNESFEEKHAKKPSTKLDEYFSDKKPHLYRLQVYPDNTFDVSVDYKIINKGSLLEDMVPPVNPPSEIDDPEDRMPSDWDEREKIPDPAAVKPEDWDEDAPEQVIDENAVKPSGWLEDEEIMIPDPTAVMPDDWDEEMDGTWEAPLIENPACESAPGCGKWTPPMMPNPEFKGKWRAPLIDNPNYRGKWRPKKIPNPEYYFDPNPFHMSSIGAVGIEVWSMSDNILFDNVIVTDEKDVADQWAAATFDIKRELVDSDGNILERMRQPTHWIQRLGRWMNNSDWFWHAYGLVTLSPVYLFFGFLFWWVRQPSEEEDEEKKAQAAAAAAKKSDALTPDDEAIEAEADVEGSGEEEQEEMEAEEEETAPLIEEKVVADADKSSSPRRRKSRKE
ncbi:calnexin-like isoform X1 [Artemia franciscana]|uniref:calnexin-like isoform X1 n=1 Tax=Artemia franciscana TaxID=6661 RepID=UPI0032D9B327